MGPKPTLVPAAGQRPGTGLRGKVLHPCASHRCPLNRPSSSGGRWEPALTTATVLLGESSPPGLADWRQLRHGDGGCLGAASGVPQREGSWERAGCPGRVEQVPMCLGAVKPRQGLMPLSCSALGSLVVGISCAALQELGREDFLGAVWTLYAQTRSLPASLVRRRLHDPSGSRAACPCPALTARCPQRRCVQEEVLRRPALSEEELAWLGPRFLMELP